MKIKIPKSAYFLTLYVLVIAGIVIFGIIPMITSLNSNRSKLAANNNKLAANQDKITELSKYNKEGADLSTIETAVNNLLPDNKNSSDFVVQIEALSNELSVVIPTLTITEPVAKAAPKATTDDESTSANSSKTKTSTSTGTGTSTPTTSKSATASGSNEIPFNLTFKSPYPVFQTFLQKIESFPRFATLSLVSISGYDLASDSLSYNLKGTIYYGK